MRSSRAHQGSSRVIWVLLEVAIALGLAIAIVWWTFPREKKPPHDPK
jgi:FlaG/FlaF family flagellin (archaellin)